MEGGQKIYFTSEEEIKDKIRIIRGQKVMLDFELAEIYGYTTKAFNQQVKNNIDRFDEDFRFKLTREEYDDLRSNFLTSSWGGSRYLPHAFTEQGIYMLMTVLKGDLAIKQSKALIRIFKVMKDYILDSQRLISQKDYLRLSLSVADNTKNISEIKSALAIIDKTVEEVMEKVEDTVTRSEIAEVISSFKELGLQSEYVLWDGQPFEADLAYTSIYQKAEKRLYVIDNYISIKTLALLKSAGRDVEIIVFSDNIGGGLHKSEIKDFQKQYPDCKIQLKGTKGRFHDRYIILDYGTEKEKIFHCGPSSKDGGKRMGSIVQIYEVDAYHIVIDELCE